MSDESNAFAAIGHVSKGSGRDAIVVNVGGFGRDGTKYGPAYLICLDNEHSMLIRDLWITPENPVEATGYYRIAAVGGPRKNGWLRINVLPGIVIQRVIAIEDFAVAHAIHPTDIDDRRRYIEANWMRVCMVQEVRGVIDMAH